MRLVGKTQRSIRYTDSWWIILLLFLLINGFLNGLGWSFD